MLERQISSKMEQQVDHRRFERSVNYLLSNVTHNKKNMIPPFTISTDAGSRIVLPNAKTKLSSKVKSLLRSDGSESRPDAVLKSGEDLIIVCDAKFYTNEIPEKVILKTIDDMRLRDTTHGLLICSQDTRT